MTGVTVSIWVYAEQMFMCEVSALESLSYHAKFLAKLCSEVFDEVYRLVLQGLSDAKTLQGH